ncbi:MAG: DUF1573 domain-containing protein [Bacteroidales bacterium]
MKRKNITQGLLVLAVLFTVSCKNRNNQNPDQPLSTDIVKNPNTANGNTDVSGLPKFAFSEEIHDFGRVIQGEKVSFSFKFKNAGKSDLIITDAKGNCGCTIADYPKTPIHPNEEGTIDVKFNTESRKGYQNKTITLIANTQPNTKVLTIKAQIQIPEGQDENE